MMRMLSGVEAPDTGTRREGHQVVMQYFAQDEAARLEPEADGLRDAVGGSPTDMVPAIRNILGGFLFSGDDIYKKAGVLSGGERTRLAVARMLLVPRTRCCSTSRRTISISTRKTSCWKRSKTTAAR